MNDTMKAAIAAGFAELVPELPAPVEPFGYGTDLKCTIDVTEDLQETDPNSPEGIGEAIFRAWTTDRGENPDDPDYGRNVKRLLNRGMTRDELRAEAGLLRAEAEKDDRVADCVVTITQTDGGRSLRIRGVVTPDDPRVSVFKMLVAVTNGAALLEEIS
jgi:hypothetical protein